MKLLDWQGMAERIAAMAAPSQIREKLSLHGATGRVLAEPIVALQPVPAFTHAVMDGFALGSLPPGQFRVLSKNSERLALDEAISVSAGQALPLAAASVVLASRCAFLDGRLAVTDAQAKDNIRRAGEEAAEGAVLVPAGTRLDARHLALAAAAGNTHALVWARPRVALLPLHDGVSALPHRQIFSSLLESRSLSFADCGVVRHTGLAGALGRAAIHHDLIIVVAESLGGEEGNLLTAIEQSGGKASILRAAMKPAKPLVLGKIGDALVLGLAGTAYATTIAAHLFLRPLLERLIHRELADVFLPVTLGFARKREPGRAEALPVRLIRDGGTMRAESAGRFGQLSALAGMDGFALIEADAPDVAAGKPALFHPLLMPLV